MRQNEKKFKVIHPFSPLHGKEFTLIERKQCWGDDRLLFINENGDYRRILTSWTDYAPQEPFITASEGRAILSEKSLMNLAELIGFLADEVSI